MELYGYETGAAALRISARSLRKLVSARKIRYCKMGRAVRFTSDMLLEFVDASTVKPAPARKAA